MWITAFLATVLIAPMALNWAFHDELFFTGHMSIAARMQNDVYPPHHVTFPEFELRYHYGYSLLCAMVTALFRIRLDMALDLVTLLSWAYCWCLLWTLGDRLLGRGGGAVMAPVVLFSGGIPFFCSPEAAPVAYNLLGICRVDGAIVNPPMVSYFFQHPWTVGIPLALCIMLVLSQRNSTEGWARYSGLGLLLVAMSFSQIALFATVGGTLLLAEPVVGRSVSRRRGLKVLLTVLAVLLAAWALGGVFAPSPDGTGADIIFHAGMADSFSGNVMWHIQAFGFLIPLGLVGFLFLRSERLFFALLLVGSLAVINLFRHTHSWDIAKFATVAGLALSVASAATVWKLWRLRPLFVGRLTGVLAMLGATAASLAFPLVFAVQMEGIPRNLFHKEAQQLSQADVSAVEWLREECPPEDIVYRRFPQASGYAQWGGIPQVWVDKMVPRHGFSRQRISARLRLLKIWPDAPQPYLAQGIRWFVVEPGEGRPERVTASWVRAGDASVVAEFGELKIVKLNSAF